MVLRQSRRAMTTMRTRIKELRARYNLTQEELPKKVGVRRETVLFIEKGRYDPSLKLAYDIAKAFRPQLMTYSSSKA
jgi:putative transcriptional regulator